MNDGIDRFFRSTGAVATLLIQLALIQLNYILLRQFSRPLHAQSNPQRLKSNHLINHNDYI